MRRLVPVHRPGGVVVTWGGHDSVHQRRVVVHGVVIVTVPPPQVCGVGAGDCHYPHCRQNPIPLWHPRERSLLSGTIHHRHHCPTGGIASTLLESWNVVVGDGPPAVVVRS